MSRLADRYAIVFLAVTAALAGTAWLFTGDPIRAVAVLVVATPCPLILAVPVAIVAGLSRAARLGILIKGGKAIEMLAQVRSLVIDKTGTLTRGHAKIVSIRVTDSIAPDELLRIAASLDQASKHVIAQTIVAEARGKGLALAVSPAMWWRHPARASWAGSTAASSWSAARTSSPTKSRIPASPRSDATGRPARSPSPSRSTASSPA
jgi:cation transport ATPase